MKNLLVIVIFVISANLFRQTVAQNSGGCYLEGVSNSQWTTYFINEAVYDTERTLFRSFASENVSAVRVASTSSAYATASLIDNTVVIAPSSLFAQYEENEPSSSSTPTITIVLQFTCIRGSSELSFRQPITDINNHDPIFSSASYTYAIPMPFPTGITISGVFGDPIVVTDIDITNVAVDFSIEPAGDFVIQYGSLADSTNKRHTAILRTATSIRLASTTSYTIIVTDRGTLPGTRSTNATLTIEVDEENSITTSPMFESSYYRAVYTKVTGSNDYITLTTNIVLEDGNYENTTFTVLGDYSSYFTYIREFNSINLVLSGDIPDNVLTTNPFIIVPIQASRPTAEYEGNTVVIVDLSNITDPVIPSPVFTSSYYSLSYNVNEGGSDSIGGETSITLIDNNYQNTNFSLEGEYAANFQLDSSNGRIELTLTTDLLEDVLYNAEFTLLTITATRNGAEVDGNTVVVITLPGTQCAQTTTEATTACPTITTQVVTVTECPTETPTTCPPCTTIFEPISTTPITTLLTTRTPSTTASLTETPITCPPCNECTTVFEPTSTTLITTPPITTTPSTTANPTETPTTCPPCPTTTEYTSAAPTTPLPVFINFQQSYYIFDLEPVHPIGVIGSISATSSIDENIVYSISSSDGSTLPSQLTLNEATGELVTSDYISSGSYYLIATATGYSSAETGNAFVYVYVGSAQICESEVRTAYSVVAKHITEEQQNYDILTSNLENYTYAIVEQFPSTNPFIFEINSTTGSLQTVGPIDREWEGISDMYVSQFTVRVRLLGFNDTFEPTLGQNTTTFYPYENPIARDIYQEDGRAWVNIEERIYNVARDTVVSIIVDDINDNRPIFAARSPIVVGYPRNDIIADVLPASLVTVKAVDADIGLNALIRYSTDNDSILIHESTGVVYVVTNIFDDSDEIEFTVVATDRNGSSDGLSSTLNIQVKQLEEEHLSILTVSGATLEDVDNALEAISASSGYLVRSLSASVVPASSQSTRLRAASDYSLKLITYAFDSNNNLIGTRILQQAIASANTSDAYNAVSWTAYSRGATSSSATGYRVSVIVLSVLLALFVVAAAVYYFRHIRRRPIEFYEQMMEETTPPPFKKNDRISHSESTKSELTSRRATGFAFNPPPIDKADDDPEDNIYPVSTKSELANRRSTEFAFHPPPIHDDIDDKDDYPYYTVSNSSVPNGKSPEFSFINTTPFKLDNRGMNESSTDDIQSEDEGNYGKLERRKSVSFNVNVEKIEIEKDDDDDDDDEDESQYDEVNVKKEENESDSHIEIVRL